MLFGRPDWKPEPARGGIPLSMTDDTYCRCACVGMNKHHDQLLAVRETCQLVTEADLLWAAVCRSDEVTKWQVH